LSLGEESLSSLAPIIHMPTSRLCRGGRVTLAYAR
jgi:hypothetical protein